VLKAMLTQNEAFNSTGKMYVWMDLWTIYAEIHSPHVSCVNKQNGSTGVIVTSVLCTMMP